MEKHQHAIFKSSAKTFHSHYGSLTQLNSLMTDTGHLLSYSSSDHDYQHHQSFPYLIYPTIERGPFILCFWYYSKALFSNAENFSRSGSFLQVGRKSIVLKWTFLVTFAEKQGQGVWILATKILNNLVFRWHDIY